MPHISNSNISWCWKKDISAHHHLFLCLADRYGGEHKAKELQKEAVYGLTELYRDEVKSARLVANPGCYPTSVQLPLVPLLKVHTCTAFYSPYISVHLFLFVSELMIVNLAKHKILLTFQTQKHVWLFSLLDHLSMWMNRLRRSRKLYLDPLLKHQSWPKTGKAPSWYMLKTISCLYSACLSLWYLPLEVMMCR